MSRLKRTRRPRTFWEEHVRAWRRSALSKADYCRQHELLAQSFYSWCRKLVAEPPVAMSPAPPLSLIPVTVIDEPPDASAMPMITARVGALSVQFPADLASSSIHRWLDAIVAIDVQR